MTSGRVLDSGKVAVTRCRRACRCPVARRGSRRKGKLRPHDFERGDFALVGSISICMLPLDRVAKGTSRRTQSISRGRNHSSQSKVPSSQHRHQGRKQSTECTAQRQGICASSSHTRVLRRQATATPTASLKPPPARAGDLPSTHTRTPQTCTNSPGSSGGVTCGVRSAASAMLYPRRPSRTCIRVGIGVDTPRLRALEWLPSLCCRRHTERHTDEPRYSGRLARTRV
ncbi:hypothetical protein GY45DRAFT_249205 [Cubamyces sp. BRFM 1775]|nr:hypothetical protein GY45DRAFT_249205 [Cubamyces sp. BRFM 1775]